MAQYRIGIDVGGTFTHAVALDAASSAPVAQAKVPTTHQAARGVAEGVVQALAGLLEESRIAPRDICFLAYSTTQVTNALLEGDVAPVGIIALGRGLEGWRARGETRLGDLELAPGRRLQTTHAYLDRDHLTPEAAAGAVRELAAGGAQAVVAAEPFSVDDPAGEQMVMAAAEEAGLPATGTHEVSGLYGLRIRTRTAVVNASLLPKAIATANMTEQAVREAGITAPLMVVRSDGGVMSIEDMRRRPLLTLLSGPAAGVAAALMYLRVSEGVFLEVGGTSTDITAIHHGRALLRSATVGGHRLFLRTLDVRTIGLAGGSLSRLADNRLLDVGPRSAHLAGLPYACFSHREAVAAPGGPGVVTLSPLAGDPADYAILEAGQGRRFGITVTCAANAAGKVPPGDWAEGDREAAEAALAALGRRLGASGREAAETVLAAAAGKVATTVRQLLDERRIEQEAIRMVAGGGGAGALGRALEEQTGRPVALAPNAPVISAIGTALAVVRDVVERTVPDASEADVLRLRQEAAERAVRAGADPESVTVDIEYDARSAVLRAIATGHTELRERDPGQAPAGDEERLAAAANSLGVDPSQVALVADSGLLRAYQGERTRGRLWGLLRQREEALAVVDHQAIVRLRLRAGRARAGVASAARELVGRLLEEHTRYGDAGAELPQLFLGVRARIIALSGLVTAAQALALAQAETALLAPQEQVLAVVAPAGA